MIEISNIEFFREVERLILDGERVTLRVKGYSMRPWLRDGRGVVILRRHRDEELQKGAIVLFRIFDQYILHRIVERRGDLLTLAGDGNYRQVERCYCKNVVAIAESIVKRNGEIMPCASRAWQLRSKAWLMLPALLRRLILSILWHIGWK